MPQPVQPEGKHAVVTMPDVKLEAAAGSSLLTTRKNNPIS